MVRIGIVALVLAVMAGVGLTVAGSATAASQAGLRTTFTGEVEAQGGLIVRAAPSRYARRVTRLENGQRIRVNCKVRGTRVDGNRLWYLLPVQADNLWVSARYVRNIGQAPHYCDPSDGLWDARTLTRLVQRQGPAVRDARIAVFDADQRINVQCYTRNRGTRWLHTGRGLWVSGDYVRVSTGLRTCLN